MSNGTSVTIAPAVVEVAAFSPAVFELKAFPDALLSDSKGRHNVKGVADGGLSTDLETNHRLDFAHSPGDLMGVLADELISQTPLLEDLMKMSFEYRAECDAFYTRLTEYEASGQETAEQNTAFGLANQALEVCVCFLFLFNCFIF